MMPFVVGAATETGVKAENEDWVLAATWRFAAGSPPLALLLALDGVTMGGAGRVASTSAGAAIAERLLRVLAQHYGLPPQEPRLGGRRLLQLAVEHGHRQVRELQRHEGLSQMSTTAVAALLHGRRLFYATAGDSRLYLRRGGVWFLLSRDHTAVGRLVELGALTPEEARFSPARHQIYNALGIAQRFFCETGELRLEARDLVVACTDGVHEYLDFTSSALGVAVEPDHADSLDGWCAALVQTAYDGGSDDNLGAAACLVREEPPDASGLPPTVLRYGERWHPVEWEQVEARAGHRRPILDAVQPYGTDAAADEASAGEP